MTEEVTGKEPSPFTEGAAQFEAGLKEGDDPARLTSQLLSLVNEYPDSTVKDTELSDSHREVLLESALVQLRKGLSEPNQGVFAGQAIELLSSEPAQLNIEDAKWLETLPAERRALLEEALRSTFRAESELASLLAGKADAARPEPKRGPTFEEALEACQDSEEFIKLIVDRAATVEDYVKQRAYELREEIRLRNNEESEVLEHAGALARSGELAKAREAINQSGLKNHKELLEAVSDWTLNYILRVFRGDGKYYYFKKAVDTMDELGLSEIERTNVMAVIEPYVAKGMAGFSKDNSLRGDGTLYYWSSTAALADKMKQLFGFVPVAQNSPTPAADKESQPAPEPAEPLEDEANEVQAAEEPEAEPEDSFSEESKPEPPAEMFNGKRIRDLTADEFEEYLNHTKRHIEATLQARADQIEAELRDSNPEAWNILKNAQLVADGHWREHGPRQIPLWDATDIVENSGLDETTQKTLKEALYPNFFRLICEIPNGQWIDRVPEKIRGRWTRDYSNSPLDVPQKLIAEAVSDEKARNEMLIAFNALVFAKAKEGLGERKPATFLTPGSADLAIKRAQEYGRGSPEVKAKLVSVIQELVGQTAPGAS